MDELALRQEMCEVGRRLWQKDLVGGAEGNLSVRLGSDRLLCTPSGVSKGHMAPDDLVVIDLEGRRQQGGQPSSEIRMHLRIYARRPDCQAVVHAHPPFATAFAFAGRSWPDDLVPEAAYVLGSVPLVPFGMMGTDDLPNSLEPYLAGHKTLLMGHHGAVAMGGSLADALYRMETLERVAALVYRAEALGGIAPLEERYRSVVRSWISGRLGAGEGE